MIDILVLHRGGYDIATSDKKACSGYGCSERSFELLLKAWKKHRHTWTTEVHCSWVINETKLAPMFLVLWDKDNE